jgi:nucleotide-binding universal stress UspA family protein
MYKRILLPTDGSALSTKAVTSGILLAKECQASVVGVHVIPAPHEDRLEAWMHHDPQFAQRRQALFEKFADQYLALVADRAQSEQVACACKKIRANDPYLALLKTAEDEGCDLIYMASHGWKGDAAQMLGSVTLKVLLHSKVPVLVHTSADASAPPG